MGFPPGPAEPVAGTVISRRPALSVRDVDAARWDEEPARRLAVDIWLDAQKSGHTREAYRRDIGLWFAWCDDLDVPVADARRADVDGWRNHLPETGGAASTVARRLASVSSFYDYWLTEDVVARNPAKRAKRPTVSPAPVSIALSRRQAADLLAYVNGLADQRAAVIVRLLAETGIRVGELTGIRPGDIGQSGGNQTLTVVRKGGEVQTLAIAGGTYGRIMTYLGGRRTGWLLEVKRTERRHPGSDGRMDRSYVRRLLRRIAREAGLPPEVHERMHPHVLRHSAATLLAADGVPPHEIQVLLGHADLRTTQRYIHHAESLDASPVYRLARILAE
jgi:site-specific recombinase XerD